MADTPGPSPLERTETSLAAISEALSGTRSLPAVLDALTTGAGAACDAILTRVWLVGPGDLCASCPMKDECPDQTRCLHLAASAGLTARLDGPFRRFPIGARRVGQAAAARETLLVRENLADAGVADVAWIALHGVRSFAAIPLLLHDELIGVLAVFSRRVISDDEVTLLRLAARHSALAITTARAFHALDATPAPKRRGADPSIPAPELRPIAEIERNAIERVLAHTGGRVSGPRGAAKILDLKPTTLQSRMKKLGVRRPPRSVR